MNPKKTLSQRRRVSVSEVFNLAESFRMPLVSHRKARLKTSPTSAFTLLELVVVLAILAIVTAMATRVVSHVEDQRRFEGSQHGLDELQDAVLGSSEDRAADGSRTVSGFMADMGRLPRTILPLPDAKELTLQELWAPSGLAPFNLRQAVIANFPTTDDATLLAKEQTDQDAQVWVPGGWHGPYLRLPAGTADFLDGWGNTYTSPYPQAGPSSEYPRLREITGLTDVAITVAGREVNVVRHLGANGTPDPNDTGYDQDQAIAFTSDRYVASIKGNIEVLDGNDPATANPTDIISVRVFGPDPSDASKIIVFRKDDIAFATNPINYEISAATVPTAVPLTVGPRVVRAYYKKSGDSQNSKASAVKTVTLRAGVNPLDLTIDRLFTPVPPVTP